MADAPPKPRRGNGNNAASSKGKQKGGRGGANATGSNARASAGTAAPTILRPQVSTTIFTPDMPRQQLLFPSSATPQKLYDPSLGPASPPAPMLPRSQPSSNRGKASPTVPSFDRSSMSLRTTSTSLYLVPDAHQATSTSLRRWKLVTPQWQFCGIESPPPQWSDMTQFLVVGCVGLEGAGKSTILSILSGHDPRGRSGNSANDPCFPIQTNDSVLQGKHETSGIDMSIASDNIVLVDSQPLLSASMLVELAQNHDSPKFGALALDQQIQLTSLHLLVFMLSVCQYLVVVYDCIDDPELWQLIQLAHLIKSRLATGDSAAPATTIPQSVAKLIFVHNKTSLVTPPAVERHSNYLRQLFASASTATSTQPETNLGHATVVDDAFTVLTMPLHSTGAANKDAVADAVQALRAHVAQLPRPSPSSDPQLTVQDWVLHGSRVFDAIRKAAPVVDYARLLQKIASSK